jgi:hypothetical protein
VTALRQELPTFFSGWSKNSQATMINENNKIAVKQS